MLKWCAYCQRLIGEIEPFEVLEFSHGICPLCLKSHRWTSGNSQALSQLTDLYHELLEIGYTENLSRAAELLEKGKRLGIRPLDFLIGILQPSLYKTGSHWETGDISIAEEHRFTAFSRGNFHFREQAVVVRA